MNEKPNFNRCALGRASFTTSTLNDCLDEIHDVIEKRGYNYICVADARSMYWANKYEDLCKIQNRSLFSVTDGMSLVRYAKMLGHPSAERITGHNLMIGLFEKSQEHSYSHYFYGNTQETLSKLKSNLLRKYTHLCIKGTCSPPFQKLENFDIDEISKTINDLSPTFFWCGLGSPKQERFISSLQPKLKATICIGVGQAFAFVAGTDRRAPKWMQDAGLEWLYLYIKKPKKLIIAAIPYVWMTTVLISTNFRTQANRIRSFLSFSNSKA